MANPFLAPDFSAVRPTAPRPRRLAGWELLEPAADRRLPAVPAQGRQLPLHEVRGALHVAAGQRVPDRLGSIASIPLVEVRR